MRPSDCVSFIALSLLCGCAIKPTPDITTRIYTKDIVNHIRCEAQIAIQLKAIKLLENNGEGARAERLKTGGPAEFAYEISHFNTLSEKLKARLSKYLGVGIAYEFTLDDTEDNNDQFQLNLLGPFSGGNGALGLKAGLERSRENVRTFTVVDTFEELVGNLKVCQEPLRPFDFIYPLSGQILVAETINTFIDLNELSGGVVGSGGALGVKSSADAQVYSDKFHFRTVVGGTLNPSGALTPSVFGPKDVSLTDTATRTDDHQVIVGISLPPTPKSTPVVKPTGIVGPVGAASLPAAQESATYRAVQAIQDAKINYFLNNFNGIVVPR